MIRIAFSSVLVDDQEKALQFYTEKLGFVKKMDLAMGDARWLTVVSPDTPDGAELLLEPDWNPSLLGAAKAFKKALVENNIPATAFQVSDIQSAYDRMVSVGVVFTQSPTQAGPVTQATLDDTCGNLIQIFQV
jgi:catechol 2,3-dioxygenase-like lactoylglutathione lyase family enzyme